MQHGDIPPAFRQLVFGFLAEEFGPHQSHHFLKCSVTLTLSICWEWRYLGKIKQVSENELVKQYQIVINFVCPKVLHFGAPLDSSLSQLCSKASELGLSHSSERDLARVRSRPFGCQNLWPCTSVEMSENRDPPSSMVL